MVYKIIGIGIGLVLIGLAFYGNPKLGVPSTLSVPQGGTGATSFSSGQCLKGAGTGAITTGACGTGGGGVSDWQKETNYGVLTLTATTTIPYWAKSSIYASSTLIVQGGSIFSTSTTTSATSTNLYSANLGLNSEYFTDLTGTGLQNTAGVLTLNATGDWTGTIDGNNFAGGAIGAGELIYGGSAGSFSELAVSTDGFILSLSGGVPAWISTSTLITQLEIDTSGELATILTDEVGTGNLAFSQYPSFTYSTTSWSGTTTIPLGVAFTSETWVGAKCFTNAGTLDVMFNDGTNYMDWLQASTTIGTITFTLNNTFTASEKRYIEVGNPATSPTSISCTIQKNY